MPKEGGRAGGSRKNGPYGMMGGVYCSPGFGGFAGNIELDYNFSINTVYKVQNVLIVYTNREFSVIIEV